MLRATHPAQLVLGLLIWSVWFVLMYGGMSVACAVAPPLMQQGAMNWINALLGVLTLVTTVLLLYWSWRCWRHAPVTNSRDLPERFIARVAAGLHFLAALATLAVGLPVLDLAPCI
ncbi:MAG: hypothetical protein WED11_11335 [Natronospirillum sp.]